MKQDPFSGVYRALSPKELAEMFMNPNAPKTEAEHWAVREIEKQRAEIERLYNEDTKTRHALKGWVYVCPDGGDEPTHERVAAVVAEVERLTGKLKLVADALNETISKYHEVGDQNDRLDAENERLRAEMQSAKADAWDEGYQDHQEMIEGIARKPSNPYR